MMRAYLIGFLVIPVCADYSLHADGDGSRSLRDQLAVYDGVRGKAGSPKELLMEDSVFQGTKDSSSGQTKGKSEFTSRRVNALVMSVVVPGAGQTMLGNTYKGLGFTLAYFGSALTALISHNNFVARGERLDALEFQYKNSTNWTSSELIYSQMKESYDLWKQDRKRRNIFLVVSAVIWIANVADVLYNTEDMGEKVFSHPMPREKDLRFAVIPPIPVSDPILTISLPLGK